MSPLGRSVRAFARRAAPWGRLPLILLVLLLVQPLATHATGRFGALLTAGERRAAWFLWTGGASLAAGIGWLLALLGRRLSASRRGRLLLAASTGLAAGWFGWTVTTGRWASRQPWRLPAVFLVAALVAGLVGWVSSWERAPHRRHPGLLVSLAAIGLVATVLLDALVLPRAYPPFHGALQLMGALAAGVAIETAIASLPLRRAVSAGYRALWLRGAPLVLFPLAFASWVAGMRGASVNTRVVLEEQGGWSGVLLRHVPVERGAPPIQPARSASRPPTERYVPPAGLPLRDRSLLLITVDALRADVLRSYGGDGRSTPHIDALADESVRFERAYTPAPHTSYAIASLMTGTYAREVLSLGGDAARFGHETLAEVLRRYGVRTAAFYPPAVFFVDGERFAPLRERGLGFEYRKEMFAPAPERVEQLDAYLREMQGTEHPLFVWIHLFEPHEPYEPPLGKAADASDRGRYLGEVAVVDEAVGALVERFRAARPGATVILTADHGEAFGEHGSRHHGSTLYEEQARVPLLWSSPGVLSPRVLHVPVDLPDLASSWLSALSLPGGARMMGDDLVPCLRGAPCSGRTAFASVGSQRMAVGVRYKLLCQRGTALCRLFDLQHDPAELRDVSDRHRAPFQRLSSALGAWLARVPDVEAAAIQSGVAWPAVLARARLGGEVSPAALFPLLEDAREGVRAEAARLLGEASERLGEEALAELKRLAASDPSSAVRLEASMALARQGRGDRRDVLLRALSEASRKAAARHRIALALAHLHEPRALPVLRAMAFDRALPEAERRQALRWLGVLRDRRSVPSLIRMLFDEGEVRLRDTAAEALGRIGDARALTALRRRMREEPYETARNAERRALERLSRSASR